MTTVKQTSLEERAAVTARMGEALLALRVHEDDAPPPLSDFFPEYASVREVPEGERARVVRGLEAEVKCRRRFGDEVYFKTRRLGTKLDTYIAAVVQLEHSCGNETLDMGGKLSWAEMEKLHRQAMAAAMRAWGTAAGAEKGA